MQIAPSRFFEIMLKTVEFFVTLDLMPMEMNFILAGFICRIVFKITNHLKCYQLDLSVNLK